jgi:hypothetical protein
VGGNRIDYLIHGICYDDLTKARAETTLPLLLCCFCVGKASVLLARRCRRGRLLYPLIRRCRRGRLLYPFYFVFFFSQLTLIFPHENVNHFHFVDKTETSGIHVFRHCLGGPDKGMIVEAMGSGVAVGDYDNDGDDDLYFVNGRPDVKQPDPAWLNALFRNDGGVFKNVTEEAGVGDMGFGMCAIFGDVDNDGWLDLFVGNYGKNVLYHNNRDGTFTDITDVAGVGDEHYAASAAFADIDNDGDLDLFVGNYVQFDPDLHGELRATYRGERVFMGPQSFDSQKDILYINNGNGTFTNGSARAGINVSQGRAMGSAFFDLENDGNLDLYVTNDSTYNHLLNNRGDGTFEDLSVLSGAGFSDGGWGGASMGVCAGDYNNDGFLDLYITSYEQETDVLYRNEGDGNLTDVTAPMGLYAVTGNLVTWGSGFCDFDADGLLDLYTANGHVYPQIKRIDPDMNSSQGVSIYQNAGNRFFDVSSSAIPIHVKNRTCRGSALLDYDNDGDMDIVVNCIDSLPLLLENQCRRGNWLQVKLEGLSAYTYGVRIMARSGETRQTRFTDGGSGYLSQNSQIVQFGFGTAGAVDELTIFWRHRDPQRILSPPINQQISIPVNLRQ